MCVWENVFQNSSTSIIISNNNIITWYSCVFSINPMGSIKRVLFVRACVGSFVRFTFTSTTNTHVKIWPTDRLTKTLDDDEIRWTTTSTSTRLSCVQCWSLSFMHIYEECVFVLLRSNVDWVVHVRLIDWWIRFDWLIDWLHVKGYFLAERILVV